MSGSQIDLAVSRAFLQKSIEAQVNFESTSMPEVGALFEMLGNELERLIKAVEAERKALEVAQRRYLYMRAWYIRGGTRQDIYPYCHIMKPTASMVDGAIDEATKKADERAVRLAAPYDMDEEG